MKIQSFYRLYEKLGRYITITNTLGNPLSFNLYLQNSNWYLNNNCLSHSYHISFSIHLVHFHTFTSQDDFCLCHKKTKRQNWCLPPSKLSPSPSRQAKVGLAFGKVVAASVEQQSPQKLPFAKCRIQIGNMHFSKQKQCKQIYLISYYFQSN